MEAESPIPISKRTKSLISHITQGLKERNEVMSLAFLSCIAGENFCLYGPSGTGKATMLKKLKSAFAGRFQSKSKIFETPADSEAISSSWEDFLLHLHVEPIQNDQVFLKLITSKKSDSQIVKAENSIAADELKEFDSQIEDITVPVEVQEVIARIRTELNARNLASDESEKSEQFYISDDRWIKIMRLLKTSAFLNGRKAVDFMDCELISLCIWKIKKTRAKTASTSKEVAKIVTDCITQSKNPFDEHITQLESLVAEYNAFVDSAFYIEQDGQKVKNPELFGYTKPSEPNIFKMNDGTSAFRILHPEEIRSYDYITPSYIAQEFSLYGNGKGAYFDQNRERIAKNDRYRDKYFVKNLTIVDGTAVWTDGDCNKEYSLRVQMIPENFVKGDEEKLSAIKAQADEKYNLIARAIEKEGEKIQKYIRSKERQYKANLFSPKSTCEQLLSKAAHSGERIFELSKLFRNSVVKLGS